MLCITVCNAMELFAAYPPLEKSPEKPLYICGRVLKFGMEMDNVYSNLAVCSASLTTEMGHLIGEKPLLK